ncbi:hypothetical protein MALV_18670 [Mycolicibacterium alvei]|uniref:Uncharacterized protein n=1 Tax=Mycolicibacterium alvei TaxID=67081 RepID=A0A6N4UTK7_9MYCO|nr:hypothetical protein MALV_18670 [Mycolicibacterium alvei]
MVIVTGLEFEERAQSGWFHAAQQTCPGERVHHVIDRLRRHGTQAISGAGSDRLDIRVRPFHELGKYRETRSGHPEPGCAQSILGAVHGPSILELVQIIVDQLSCAMQVL